MMNGLTPIFVLAAYYTWCKVAISITCLTLAANRPNKTF